MPVSDQLIDQLLADYKSPEDLLGEQGILKQLTKKLTNELLKPRWSNILIAPNMMQPVKAVNRCAASMAISSLCQQQSKSDPQQQSKSDPLLFRFIH